MAGETISLDELQKQQERSRSLSTIDGIADQPDRVKVTPFARDAGCLCSYAVTVPTGAIGTITTTEEVHDCCGKTLMVVEVSFADPTLNDIYQQIGNSARRTTRTNAREQIPALAWNVLLERALAPGRRTDSRHTERLGGWILTELAEELRTYCSKEYRYCQASCAERYRPGSSAYEECMEGCDKAYSEC